MPNTSPDTCVAFYSRSGHSKRLATKLAEKLKAEQVEITAPAYEGRIFGYMRAGYDSLRQNCVLGPQFFSTLTTYRHVILVGPVWTSYPAVPLRALLRAGTNLPQAVSLFLTSGAHSPPEKAYEVGASDLGRPFVATATLPNSAEGTGVEGHTIAAFLSELEAPDAKAV
ncbi:hypothetical protein [uncultured Tateyamaria sp.]|uniref:hypothetical protein n=1 Tax=uncultured Tateyamaria sp. TaxID=455651 RepID=UPI00262471B5|nr:hypothetical protein [uncultured Tateyamaria sp.]